MDFNVKSPMIGKKNLLSEIRAFLTSLKKRKKNFPNEFHFSNNIFECINSYWVIFYSGYDTEIRGRFHDRNIRFPLISTVVSSSKMENTNGWTPRSVNALKTTTKWRMSSMTFFFVSFLDHYGHALRYACSWLQQ